MRTIREASIAIREPQPDAPFLLAPEPGTTMSYAGLRITAQALCAELAAMGVRPGEVVSYLLPNGVAAASVFLGAMYGGFVVSPISMLRRTRSSSTTSRTRGRASFHAAPEFVERLEAIVARIGSRAIVRPTSPDGLQLPRISEALRAGTLDAREPALLMYTSGTTGRPKGALLSHANLIHAGRSVAQAHRLTSADRVLSSLPLYHVNGQCIATISPLVSGGSIVMPHRSACRSGGRSSKPIGRRGSTSSRRSSRISSMRRTPRRRRPQRAAAYGLRGRRPHRCRRSTTAHSRRGSAFRCSKRWDSPNARRSRSRTRSNPASGASDRRDGRSASRRGSSRPTARRSASASRAKSSCAADNVMLGYHKDPEATARTLREGGWLANGDLGYRDADGFYFITGRLKELIIKGGENIAPREIDEALLKHPAVLEAAAVGIPTATTDRTSSPAWC
jgi:long-chain acyl-CoA synthetase